MRLVVAHLLEPGGIFAFRVNAFDDVESEAPSLRRAPHCGQDSRMLSLRSLVLSLSLALVACGESSALSDGGSSDSGVDAASAADSGPRPDAQTADAQTTDAGPGDSGFDGGSEADRCAATGGTLGTKICCTSTDPYPNTCVTGACGCAPSDSHSIADCSCPAPKCFNPGTGCVPPP